jgi:hypothetical protein
VSPAAEENRLPCRRLRRPLTRSLTGRRQAVPTSSSAFPRHGERPTNAIIYQAEYAFLTKRLDAVERTLAWLESRGRRFTRPAPDLTQQQADLGRRLLQIEDLTAYDEVA